MNVCGSVRAQFSSYLDGMTTGKEMQQIASHLQSCADCSREFNEWRYTQSVLAQIGPAKAPADLALRLRVAISQERAKTPKRDLARLQLAWENSIAPFLLQASAGFASTVLLLGTVALLVGMFATPEPVEARDEPLGMATAPRFLYTASQDATTHIGERDNPVVVEAYVNGAGRVYDFHIVSGPQDPATRSALSSLLLFSVFEPARVFGEPVRGVVVLSFAGVDVRG
ncbi:MAG TPA: zf-HC2 domain-containing protein [Acidisarcina sp.]|nr:zf-HC2 domain-containing protein [Acidisarcina sp.]